MCSGMTRDNGHKKKQEEVYTSYMGTHFDYEDSQAVHEVSQLRLGSAIMPGGFQDLIII